MSLSFDFKGTLLLLFVNIFVLVPTEARTVIDHRRKPIKPKKEMPKNIQEAYITPIRVD